MGNRRVVVIGAGIAGLSAALALAARGLDVAVVERAERPGGKMREVELGGAATGWVRGSQTITDSVSMTVRPFVTSTKLIWRVCWDSPRNFGSGSDHDLSVIKRLKLFSMLLVTVFSFSRSSARCADAVNLSLIEGPE